jgi:hypothetical protein
MKAARWLLLYGTAVTVIAVMVVMVMDDEW